MMPPDAFTALAVMAGLQLTWPKSPDADQPAMFGTFIPSKALGTKNASLPPEDLYAISAHQDHLGAQVEDLWQP